MTTWQDWQNLLQRRDLDVLAKRTGFVKPDGSYDSERMPDFEEACTAERIAILERAFQ